MKKLMLDKFRESVEEVALMFFMTQPEEIESKNMYNSPILSDAVTLNISLMGDLSGCVVLTMNLETAINIASVLTMQSDIIELDSIHESAIREVLNMMMGTFACKVSQITNPMTNEVYDIDIGVPISMVSKEEIEICVDNSDLMHQIRFNIENIGGIELSLAVKGL